MHILIQPKRGAYASIRAGIVDIQRQAGGPGGKGRNEHADEREQQDQFSHYASGSKPLLRMTLAYQRPDSLMMRFWVA